MKNSLVLLFGINLCLCAQTDSAGQKFRVKKPATAPTTGTTKINGRFCILVIDGVQFESGWKIKKDLLLKLCTLQVFDKKTNTLITPVSFKWTISHYGEVYHGQKTTYDCAKVQPIINQLSSGDIIFFEEIKCKETATLCSGQYVLKVE